MFIKLYSKLKQLIKQNIWFVIFTICFILVVTIKIPYKVETYGSMININDKIIIDNESKINGSYNITYVLTSEARLSSLILSLFNKNMELTKIEDKNEEKNYSASNKILFNNSISNAYINAYKNMNIDLDYSNNNIVVGYVGENADTNLKIGDKITTMNNTIVNSTDDIKEIIKTFNFNDRISINSNNYAYVKELNNKKTLYLYLVNNYDFKDLKYKFKENESGPSGGFIMSLLIYDKLNKEDLSKGRIIAGTGTIDENGNIGEIDGIKYKILGALDSDIFFLPIENYEEAKEFVNKRNLKINLVPVKTFKEAINYLKK